MRPARRLAIGLALLLVLSACSASESAGEQSPSSVEVETLVEILDRTTPDGVRLVLSEGVVEYQPQCFDQDEVGGGEDGCRETGEGVQIEVSLDGSLRSTNGRLDADLGDPDDALEVFDFGFGDPPGSSVGQPVAGPTVSPDELARPYSVLVLEVSDAVDAVRALRDGGTVDEMAATGGFVAFATEGADLSYELVMADGLTISWTNP